MLFLKIIFFEVNFYLLFECFYKQRWLYGRWFCYCLWSFFKGDVHSGYVWHLHAFALEQLFNSDDL